MLNVTDTVLRIGVIAEEFNSAAFTLSLNLFEKLDHSSGVVAAVVQDLCSHQVGLTLRVTRIFQKERIEAEADAQLPQDPADRIASEHTAQNRERRLRKVRFRNLICAVTQNDVADLVRHQSRDLVPTISSLDRAAVDIDESAGQRECVDGGVIHDLELIGILFPWCVRGQILS